VSPTLTFFSNIVVPCLSSIFLLVYIFYFSVSSNIKSSSLRLFQLFLISFTIFLIGRPLQVLTGPYPWPLIIVNIRVFLLSAVVAPLIILASDVLDNKSHKTNLWIIAFCVLLGIVYVVFNTLGTKDSYTLFEFYGLIAYDNLTPTNFPPYYGREVTLIAQTSIGIILLIFSLLRLSNLLIKSSKQYFFFKKNFFVNAGIFIFALSFIVGSVLKQWWIYYVTSIIITMLFGGSVLYDIKELNIFHEKTLPLLKNELVNRIFMNDVGEKELVEILSCIGKNTDVNCAAVIQLSMVSNDNMNIVLSNKLEDLVVKQCSRYYPEEIFITLPIFGNKLCVLFKVDKNGEYKILEIFEKVANSIRDKFEEGVVIGIGSVKTGIELIGESFYEAMHAKKYAENNNIEGVVYYSNIKQIENHQIPYPYKEKQILIDKIKTGDTNQLERATEDFLSKLKMWTFESASLMKLKAYETIGALVSVVDVRNEDRDKLNDLVEQSFKRISHVKEVIEIEPIVQEVAQKLVNIVRNQYEKRKNLYVSKAVEFIEKKYKYPITFKKIAAHIGVSPSYFLHLFKRETGLTFGEYLTHYRIQIAKKLLLEDKLNITEIAYEVGFKNSNYFSYVFRKIVGISAKDFKKSIGKIRNTSASSSPTMDTFNLQIRDTKE